MIWMICSLSLSALSAQTNYEPKIIDKHICFTFLEGKALLDIVNNRYPKEILKNAERQKIIDKLERKLKIKKKANLKRTGLTVLIVAPPVLILGFIAGFRMK